MRTCPKCGAAVRRGITCVSCGQAAVADEYAEIERKIKQARFNKEATGWWARRITVIAFLLFVAGLVTLQGESLSQPGGWRRFFGLSALTVAGLLLLPVCLAGLVVTVGRTL